MALFVLIVLIINGCFTTLLGSESDSNGLLVIQPSTMTGGQQIGLYKVDDVLNLTCMFMNKKKMQNVLLDWIVPSKAYNSQHRVLMVPGSNSNNLIIENLQENDSGEYKCRASHNGTPLFNSETSVRINVKNKKNACAETMFQCSAGICIHKRYTCDGFNDCKNNEDEKDNLCGVDPCENKIRCPDGRCIPASWCCESYREPNCTIKVKPSCCTHLEKLTRDLDNDSGFQYEQQRFHDMGFLQTTVYTVIGCAMAFMFIVTIIIIAICRVHIRRNPLSRCPAASNRNLTNGRGNANLPANFHGLPFYDLDLYFNRPGFNNDLMSVNPLLVTYNINNGVQFVGRPIDPPPYCEIVASPPREGPPPPYASQENICVRHSDKNEQVVSEIKECSEIIVEAEMTECDALLGATSQNSISVISCNAIDVIERGDRELSSDYVYNVAEDENVNASTSSSPSSSKEEGDEERVSDKEAEITSKDNLETETSNKSSQCVGGNVKIVENDEQTSKNDTLNILVLKSCDNCDSLTESNGTYKNGESSSYVSSSDISNGAVKKIVSSKSFEGSARRKSKTSPKSHVKKF